MQHHKIHPPSKCHIDYGGKLDTLAGSLMSTSMLWTGTTSWSGQNESDVNVILCIIKFNRFCLHLF